MGYTPILCLDFDGVIHSYTSGWKGAKVIPDPPVPGAIEFIQNVINSEKFELHIFSSRSNQEGGIQAMQDWLFEHCSKAMDETPPGSLMTKDAIIQTVVYNIIKWPTEKPPALLTIDDRAFCFEGKWPTLDYIADFKPWNKK